jgi:hypothetical protein
MAATLWGTSSTLNSRFVTEISLERIAGQPEELVRISVVDSAEVTIPQHAIAKDMSLVERAAQFVPIAVQGGGEIKSRTYYVDIQNGAIKDRRAFNALFDPRHTGR